MNKSVKNLFMSSKSMVNNCLMNKNNNNLNNNNSQNFGNRNNNNNKNNLNEGFCTVREQINAK
jgi:hypothetical protein